MNQLVLLPVTGSAGVADTVVVGTGVDGVLAGVVVAGVVGAVVGGVVDGVAEGV